MNQTTEWNEVTNMLLSLQSKLREVPSDSPRASQAQDFLVTVQAMIVEAWDLGSPLTRQKVELPVKRVQQQQAQINIEEIPAQFVAMFDARRSRMMVDGSCFGLSLFFACVYVALLQNGIMPADNLSSFHKSLKVGFDRLKDEHPGYSVSYQAISDAIRDWADFVIKSNPYTPYYICSIGEDNVKEECLAKFTAQRALYARILDMMREVGIIAEAKPVT